jgi:hypothetical protein
MLSGVLALHVVFLACNSAGLWLSPSYCFALYYPYINQILHFLCFSLLLQPRRSSFYETRWLWGHLYKWYNARAAECLG